MTCPELEVLDRYVVGTLSDEACSELDEHLGICPSCRELVRDLRKEDAALSRFESYWPHEDAQASNVKRLDPHLPGYELVRVIHEGGQGIVYEARQLSTNRSVAVKLLLHGRYATRKQLRRFEQEIDLAAALDHSNIVTVFDSGTTGDNRLFLVMRLVEGQPLDEHVRSRITELDACLDLFSRIARAVNHAHQRGILHRDLKPNNILVDDEGEPHLLDFGLAKPLEEADVQQSIATQSGEFVGTLAYAAPEQISGAPNAVDVRSDVYALGVILFEMVTGTYPYPVDVRLDQLVHNISEREATRPSSIIRTIDGDLDTILLKALSKDPDRRYQSVADLLRDIEYYRTGWPIEARRDSTWYVLRKTLRRHRVPVVMAAIVLIALVGSTATSALFWRQSVLDRDAAIDARDDADDARVEAEIAQADAEARAEQLADLSTFTSFQILEVATPWKQGEDVTVVQAMDEIVGLLDDRFESEPKVEAQLRHSIGNIYQETGRYVDAEEHLQRAIELRTRAHGPDARATLVTKVWLWRLRCRQRRYDEAEAIIFDVIERQRRTTGEIDCAEHYQFAGQMMMEQDRLEEAEELLRTALNLGLQKWSADHVNVIATVIDLVELLRRQQRSDELAALCIEHLNRVRPVTDAERAEPIRAMRALADLAAPRMPSRFMEPLWRACAESMHLHLDDDERCNTAVLLRQLGYLLWDRASTEETEQTFRDAVVAFQRIYGTDHYETGLTRVWLGRALNRNEKYAEAERHLREGLETFAREYGEEHPLLASSMTELAAALIGQQRFDEAELLLLDAAQRVRQAAESNPLAGMHINEHLVGALVGQGRLTEAVQLSHTMLDACESVHGRHHLTTSRLRHRLEVELGRHLDRDDSAPAP